MTKVILATVLIIVFILVVFGAFYLIGSLNKGAGQNNTFEIQGVQVEILKEGSGEASEAGDSLTVNYIGTLRDGKKFDSGLYTFILSRSRVIKGWDLGVAGMKVGEKRKLTIPPELAYGENGVTGRIPPNATLTFEIELLKINK